MNAAPPLPAVQTFGLTRLYGPMTALSNLDLTVNWGDLFGLIGSNGAGKTTTLRILARFLAPSAGRAVILGHEVVNDVLEFVGLTEKKDALIGALSRGMQQRLGLARVLIHDPQLLLLDEPASGLDPRARIEMMEILRELQRPGKTIISSHILSELESICKRVAIIERRRLNYAGPVPGVRDQMSSGRVVWVRVASDTEPAVALLKTLSEVTGVTSLNHKTKTTLASHDTDPSRLADALVRSGAKLTEFREDEIGLEEVFLRVTRKETQ